VFRQVVTSRLRAALALIVAIIYLFANTGILPSAQWLAQSADIHLARLSGQRYPCEDHACGCASAHECWTNCCCYTHHQRIVWALRNGVAPPPDVVVTDEDLIAAADDADTSAVHCSACVPGIQAKLARGVPLAAPADQPQSAACASCDSPDTGACTTCETPASHRVSAGPARAWSPLSCKSLSSLLAAGIGLGLPWRIESLLPATPVAFLAPRPAARAPLARALDVTPPPPRCGPRDTSMSSFVM